MATDLSLLILDVSLGVVVCARWLGGHSTLEAARSILVREPTASKLGLGCWTDVTPEQIASIAHAAYADGASPAEVPRLSTLFPTTRYVWMLVTDV